SPEMAVVDLKMPGGSGLELVRDLRAIDEATRIVVLTGYGSIATAIEAVRLGATYYLPKPADADDILAAFEKGMAPPLTKGPPLAVDRSARVSESKALKRRAFDGKVAFVVKSVMCVTESHQLVCIMTVFTGAPLEVMDVYQTVAAPRHDAPPMVAREHELTA